jgi:GDPmannose 4,6-dehydratase
VTHPVRSLITGITGQDGWYLSGLLRAEGGEVTGVVRPGDTAEVPDGVTTVPGDLSDPDSLVRAVEAADPDEVYNLAGLTSVGASWQDPAVTADVNGTGFVRLLDAVRRHSESTGRPIRVVQASSAEIFGHAPAPQDEQTPLAPVSPYGAAKAFAHHVASLYRATGVPVSTAILYNHESPRRPQSFVTRKITHGVAAIARGRQDTLLIGNLEPRRDWGFAGDYARALRLIARHPDPDDFVVASGVSRSVGDFVAAAFREVGIDDWRSHVEIDSRFTRAADPGEQRGDASKARRELSWEPEVSFEEMVAAMVAADLALLDDDTP